VVDGISDRDHVAELFATKYRDLYSSVSYYVNDLQDFINNVENVRLWHYV